MIRGIDTDSKLTVEKKKIEYRADDLLGAMADCNLTVDKMLALKRMDKEP